MTLNFVDWAIVAAYFLLSAGIGLYFTKRGGESLSEYFLSGRQVPCPLFHRISAGGRLGPS